MKKTIRFNQSLIFDNHNQFKNYRHFIEYLFLEVHGLRITCFRNEYGVLGQVVKKGLTFERSDSDINLVFEVTAEVGVNAEEVPESIIADAKKRSQIRLKGSPLHG